MARSSRCFSPTAVDPTTRASYSTLRLLFLLGGVASFSVRAPSSFFEYRLVDHVDRLEQRRQTAEPGGSDSARPATAVELVPPPHLFRLPAPGGDVCLIVDENGAYHAVRDAFPPLGFPVSETGVVDTQVNAIGDELFGTRYHLSDGTVRGPWCPGGTAAGPLLLLLLRVARRLPPALLQGVLRRIPFQQQQRRRRRRVPNSAVDPREAWAAATALEVLPVTEYADGSLTVTLPSCPLGTGTAAEEGGEEENESGNVLEGVVSSEDGGGDNGDDDEVRGVKPPPPPSASCERGASRWAAACGLAGYEY